MKSAPGRSVVYTSVRGAGGRVSNATCRADGSGAVGRSVLLCWPGAAVGFAASAAAPAAARLKKLRRPNEAAFDFAILNPRLGGCCSVLCLHVLAADLEIEAIRVLHVETVFRVGMGREAAALQFGFHRILVPAIDRVGHVVDARRRSAVARVARQQKGVAEREIALLAVIVRD